MRNEIPAFKPGGHEDVGINLEMGSFFPLNSNQQKQVKEYKSEKIIDHVKKRDNPEKRLEQINFNELKRIFAGYMRRSGIPVERMNFIEPDNIRFIGEVDEGGPKVDRSSGAAAGHFSVGTNRIYIQISMFRSSSEMQRKVADFEFMTVISHEEVHAISKNACFFSFDEQGAGKMVAASSGYGSNHQEGESLRLFDEGLTEWIAFDVMQEYLRSYPALGKVAGKTRSEIDNFLFQGSAYKEPINFLISFANLLADVSEIKPKVIMDSLIRSKLLGPKGEKFDIHTLQNIDVDGNEPAQAGIPIIFPENLYKKLTEARNAEDIRSLNGEILIHRNNCLLYLSARDTKTYKRSAHIVSMLLKVLPTLNDFGHSIAR